MKTGTAIPGCEVLPAFPSPGVPARKTKTSDTKRRATGRFGSLNAFVDASMRSVSGTAAKVWFVVFRDTKPNGLARVSDTDLGRRAGVSARSARRARTELVKAGLLVVVRRGGLRIGASTYRVRTLASDKSGQPKAVKSGHGLRTRMSCIPERDQNGRPTLCRVDALEHDEEAGGAA